MNKVIIALVGESGAGKDYVLNYLMNTLPVEMMNRMIPFTTRPKRDYEIDGKDYYFITEQDFYYGNFYVFACSEFNNWHYGFNLNSLDNSKINIGIFNPQNIIKLHLHPELLVTPVYITAPHTVRMERCYQREKNVDITELQRRALADEKDFEELDDKYKVFTIDTSKNDKDQLLEKLKQMIISIYNTYFPLGKN